MKKNLSNQSFKNFKLSVSQSEVDNGHALEEFTSSGLCMPSVRLLVAVRVSEGFFFFFLFFFFSLTPRLNRLGSLLTFGPTENLAPVFLLLLCP